MIKHITVYQKVWIRTVIRLLVFSFVHLVIYIISYRSTVGLIPVEFIVQSEAGQIE